MNDVLLRGPGLHKTYQLGKRELTVLRGVDVELKRGDFLGFRGASGAGKSTLLHLLGGLDTPSKETFGLRAKPGFAFERRLASVRNKEVGYYLPGLLFVAGAGCARECLPAGAHGESARPASCRPGPELARPRGA